MKQSKYFKCYLLGGWGNQIFQNIMLDWIKKNHNSNIIVSKADYLPYKNKIRNKRKIQSLYYADWINEGNLITQDLMINLRIKYRLNNVIKYKLITDKYLTDYIKKNKIDFFDGLKKSFEMKAHCIIPQLINYSEFNSSWIELLNRFKRKEKKMGLIDYEDNFDIVIHHRRGDYLNFPELYYELKDTYFLNAIDLLKEKLKIFGNPKCLIIGNDINWAKANIGTFIDAKYQYKSEFEDFRTILRSRNLIISNSSFSLSAAILGMFNNPSKEVVSPASYYVKQNQIGTLAHKSWHLVDN